MHLTEKLNKAFLAGQFEPSIRHIRFPHFKNLTPYLKLDFSSPITAIVGANGSNKSSVLRAIACCPHSENIGDHWFSTEVDPIDESGGRPRYIFGYIDKNSKKIVEVIQVRIRKPLNPDYWEPSRPLISDDMEKMPTLKAGQKVPGRTQTRWAGINKELVLLDFRSEISAFDKLFYHGSMTESLRSKSSKEHLRSRSKLLKRVIEENLQSLRPFKKRQEMIISNEELPQEQLDAISEIIGRKYLKIRLIKHNLFESCSYTAILQTSDLSYSEAFAGSGEFAVVMLVHKICECEPGSLIVLDEPEVSLHPGAQLKLMEFLFGQCLEHKHQAFIGTHSKFIVDELPSNAIILLQHDPSTGKIVAEQNIKPREAFFHLGLNTKNKKRIFVEDLLAAEIIKKCLRTIGPAALNQFDILVYPGGAKSIFGKCMTAQFQTGDTNSIFYLDGDQHPKKKIIHPKDIPQTDHKKIEDELYKLTEMREFEFALNGGNDKNFESKKHLLERDFLSYVLERTYYLPAKNPEVFVWENMQHDSASNSCNNLPPKDRYAKLTKLEKGLMDTENVRSNEILETQIRRLATVNNNNPDLLIVIETLKMHIE
ncbi:ATP-dependent nuclease [Pseudomonas sp. McL0111]|uniref:ATP-dependent nuclease n=1 Tax=Pseudomonas sp. McL0111 TaxID=3457357 RepID=UPI00403EE6C5